MIRGLPLEGPGENAQDLEREVCEHDGRVRQRIGADAHLVHHEMHHVGPRPGTSGPYGVGVMVNGDDRTPPEAGGGD